MSLVRRVYSNLYWYTSRWTIYIVVRHCIMFYVSRVTIFIVLRHCMICLFFDCTIYCKLFHLPHFVSLWECGVCQIHFLCGRVISNLYWFTSWVIIYIVVRHCFRCNASRLTIFIVVRHCMICDAFFDSTLYCLLFQLPHFSFCECGVHHFIPDAWHALHSY